MAGQLHESLEEALLIGGDQVRRLGSAGTSVTFLVVDAPKMSVTFLLHAKSPESGAAPPITIEIDSDQALAFARGELSLPTRILAATSHTSGPVREYLSLDPIVRSLLARANDQEDGGGTRAPRIAVVLTHRCFVP